MRRRRSREVKEKEYTLRIHGGYSGEHQGYSWGTVRVQWGTLGVQ